MLAILVFTYINVLYLVRTSLKPESRKGESFQHLEASHERESSKTQKIPEYGNLLLPRTLVSNMIHVLITVRVLMRRLMNESYSVFGPFPTFLTGS